MSYTPKNLYPPFSSSSVNWGYWSQTSETLNGQPCFARSGAWQGLCNEIYLDVGTYTYSCYIKSAALRERSALNIEPNNSSEYAHYSDRATIEYLYSEYFDIPGDNTWRRYYLIVRVTSAGYVAPRAESRFNLSTAMTISAPQLEVGDEMTDYEPYNCTWYIGLDGELHNTQFIDLPAAAMSQPYPYALWRITPGVNDGYPYNMLLPDIARQNGAFENCTSLQIVRIPKTVKAIGDNAFTGTNLKSVIIASDCEYSESSFPEDCKIYFYPD